MDEPTFQELLSMLDAETKMPPEFWQRQCKRAVVAYLGMREAHLGTLPYLDVQRMMAAGKTTLPQDMTQPHA